jgi:hypothetical protein
MLCVCNLVRSTSGARFSVPSFGDVTVVSVTVGCIAFAYVSNKREQTSFTFQRSMPAHFADMFEGIPVRAEHDLILTSRSHGIVKLFCSGLRSG